MRKRILSLAIMLFWISSFGQSQSKTNEQIKLPHSYSNLLWSTFVQKIEHNYPLQFFYQFSEIPEFVVSFDSDSIELKVVLNEQLIQYNVFASFDNKGNVFLTKNGSISSQLPSYFFNAAISNTTEESSEFTDQNYIKTIQEFVAQSVVVGTKEKGVNKLTATINGIAINSLSGQAITEATIVDLISGKGVVTDSKGNYKLTLNIGKHVLKISSVNIVEKQIEVDLQSDGVLNLSLDDKIFLLKDVIVNAEKENNIRSTKMGFDKVSAKSVKKIPLVFGEKDIVKVALLLPGVQTVGEGSSGFNVRGSPTDQNLFYINHVPIYNTSHAAGFFSAFNADVVDEFSLFKSNIPLQYGGRISSVFEIKTKTGSKEKITARGGIGPITGRLTVEGPLKKEKSSFLIGVRSTYSDWVLNFIKDPIIKNSHAQFADAITNFSFQLNDYNQLNLFSYFSTDKMNIYTQSKYDYQNFGGSVSWMHYFKNKNSFELSLVHSAYAFNEENNQLEIASYSHNNQLQHTELKAIFEFVPRHNHHFQFGLNSTLYQIDKGIYEPLSALSLINTTSLGTEKGLESALFLSDDWKINENLSFQGGLRFNQFTYFGPQDVNKYRDGMPFTDENLVEVLHFNDWESIKSYSGLDFRFALNHLLTENISVKAAYNRLHQFIYMLSNTIAVSPNYRWKLSDYNTKPIVGDQITLGVYSNLWNSNYEFSLETYYKFSQNIVEIKDGANFFLNENMEQTSLQGNLNAFGAELMFKKLKGRLNGWINYTYSNSKVLVNSPFAENRINYGQPYPSNYDKPHAFNLVANYDFSRRVSFSGNIVYSTGRPITYPTAVYYYGGIPTLSYSSRNEYRLPDYFRVDVSLNVEGNLLKRKLGHGSWSFSVYNLLGRKNAFSVYFEENEGLIKAYKLSIFGAPIVSVTYNIKLGNYASE